jgi:hypothetical protein
MPTTTRPMHHPTRAHPALHHQSCSLQWWNTLRTLDGWAVVRSNYEHACVSLCSCHGVSMCSTNTGQLGDDAPLSPRVCAGCSTSTGQAFTLGLHWKGERDAVAATPVPSSHIICHPPSSLVHQLVRFGVSICTSVGVTLVAIRLGFQDVAQPGHMNSFLVLAGSMALPKPQ